MTQSILTTTKKILGLSEEYTAYDVDIIIHINNVLMILSQLGIGPDEGAVIEDSSVKWTDIFDNNMLLNSIKVYVYIRVRLLFDPPTTSYLIESMKEQLREIEYRLSVQREGVEWSKSNTLASKVCTGE
jgi:hypothetical protein